MRYLITLFLPVFVFIVACSENETTEQSVDNSPVEVMPPQVDFDEDSTFSILVSKADQGYLASLKAPGELQIFEEGAFKPMEIKEGKYVIDQALPQLGRILLSEEQQVLVVLIDGEISGNLEKGEVIITDAGENNNLQWFNTLYNDFTQKQQALFQAVSQKGDINRSPELQKEYSQKLAELDKSFELKLKAFNDSITPSFVGMLATSRLFKEENMAYLKPVIAAYDNPGYVYAQEMVNEYKRRQSTTVGFEAPDFELNQPDGSSFQLSSLRGKVVLIDFWASWCGPCRKENPNVLRVYQAYKNKGFDIISVSLDKNPEDWKTAIEKDGLIWNHVWDAQGEVASIYAVNAIPQTFLLNEKGEIIAKNLRGPALEEKLAKVL